MASDLFSPLKMKSIFVFITPQWEMWESIDIDVEENQMIVLNQEGLSNFNHCQYTCFDGKSLLLLESLESFLWRQEWSLQPTIFSLAMSIMFLSRFPSFHICFSSEWIATLTKIWRHTDSASQWKVMEWFQKSLLLNLSSNNGWYFIGHRSKIICQTINSIISRSCLTQQSTLEQGRWLSSEKIDLIYHYVYRQITPSKNNCASDEKRLSLHRL